MRYLYTGLIAITFLISGCSALEVDKNVSGETTDNVSMEERIYATEDENNLLRISNITEDDFQVNLSLAGEENAHIQLQVKIGEETGNGLEGTVEGSSSSQDIIAQGATVSMEKEGDNLHVEIEGIPAGVYEETNQDVELVDRIEEEDIIPFIEKVESDAVDLMADYFIDDPTDLNFDIPFDELRQELDNTFTSVYINDSIKTVYDDPSLFYEYSYDFPLAHKGEINDYMFDYTFSEILVYVQHDTYMELVPTFYQLVVDEGQWKINQQSPIMTPSIAEYEVIDALDIYYDTNGLEIKVLQSDSFEEVVEIYKEGGNFSVSIHERDWEGGISWFQVNSVDGTVYKWDKETDVLTEI